MKHQHQLKSVVLLLLRHGRNSPYRKLNNFVKVYESLDLGLSLERNFRSAVLNSHLCLTISNSFDAAVNALPGSCGCPMPCPVICPCMARMESESVHTEMVMLDGVNVVRRIFCSWVHKPSVYCASKGSPLDALSMQDLIPQSTDYLDS